MELKELKLILKRLFREYVRVHLKKILIALILSLVVAGSTAGIAWLLDPAVKKIFMEKNQLLTWTIPLLIVIAFTSKGLSLYFARLNILRIGHEVSGELQKKIQVLADCEEKHGSEHPSVRSATIRMYSEVHANAVSRNEIIREMTAISVKMKQYDG